jgi:phytoene dehydrogenase-like protein
MGGSEGIINALVRGLTRHGGRLALRSHVDRVVVENGRAAGVLLRPRGSGGGGGNANDLNAGSAGAAAAAGAPREFVRARRGVISNASVWDTAKLLPPGAVPAEFLRTSTATPMTGSFLHLHLGIDAEGLPQDLDCHHL